MRTASRARHIVCPFCESGELVSFGGGFARCDSCAMPLVGSTLETLRDIIGLPDALGTHPCECGHPEMRVLPDGVFYCRARFEHAHNGSCRAAGRRVSGSSKTG